MNDLCPKCSTPYRQTDMVECPICKMWFHYECVDVDDGVAEIEDWRCPCCTALSAVPKASSRMVPFEKHRTVKHNEVGVGQCGKPIIPLSTQSTTTSERRRQRWENLREQKLLLEEQQKLIQNKLIICQQMSSLLVESDDESQRLDDDEIGEADPETNLELSRRLEQAATRGLSSSVPILINQNEGQIEQEVTQLGLLPTLLRPIQNEVQWHPSPPSLHAQQEALWHQQPAQLNLQEYKSVRQPLPKEHSSQSLLQQTSIVAPPYNGRSSRLSNVVVQNKNNQTVGNNVIASARPGNPLNDVSLCPLNSAHIAARQSIPRDLPFFDGDPRNWYIFISSFNRSTALCGFNDSENLIRLDKALKGNARKMVQGFLHEPRCVKDIIINLKLLFGRPEQILDSFINAVRQHAPVKMEKLESLVEYGVTVQNLCACLQASDVAEYSNNPMLMHELVSKLPAQLKVQWAMHRATQSYVGILQFGQWLHQLALNICTAIPTLTFSENKGSKHERTHLHDGYAADKTIRCKLCDKSCQTVLECAQYKEAGLNKRWRIVKDLRLCRICLRKHRFPCKSQLKCEKCHRVHHTTLHKEIELVPSQVAATSSFASVATNNQVSSVNADININYLYKVQDIRFRFLPVRILSGHQEIVFYAFLDEGSSTTMIDEKLAHQLNLSGEVQPLCLKWTGGQHRVEDNSKLVRFSIAGTYVGAKIFHDRLARTVSNLSLPTQTLDMKVLSRQFPYLQNLPVESYRNIKPDMLIGLDNWELAVPLKVKEGGKFDPIAAKCRLGWSIFAFLTGHTENEHQNFHESCDCAVKADDIELHNSVKSYFAVESLGVQPPINSKESLELHRAELIMSNTTKWENNRYTVGLLWKHDHLRLPDSRNMALKRHQILMNRLKTDPVLAQRLKSHIQDLADKGYVRKLLPEEIEEQHEKIWYLPLLIALNPNKPDKFRLVWDAAASVNGVSLNSMLLTGHDLLSSLLGILLRFRQKKVAYTGDIKEMFLRIGIRDEDQHALRFLWQDDEHNKHADVYVVTVLIFGATCAPSYSQYIKNVNALRFKNEFPRPVTAIVENHYVDDYLDSVDDEVEAINLAKQVSQIHRHANFEIRNWKSNSIQFMREMNDQVEETVVNLNLSPEPILEKILGMWWHLSSDCFTYSIRSNKRNTDILCGNKIPTKRELLRILMSIYDPMGLLAHFMVYLKILLQEVWRSKLAWDDPLSEELYNKFSIWKTYLPNLKDLRIPRCFLQIFNNYDKLDVQLHTFVDASENASATVAYLRISDGKTVVCSIVGAKTKVAPLKIQSIPRLELDAAVLGARFSKSIREALSIHLTKITYWSDSTTVLCWLRAEDSRKYGKFVSYRIAEIQDLSIIADWRYVPSGYNVADEATKWNKPPNLSASGCWFRGPEFLYDSENEWPLDITHRNDEDEFSAVHDTKLPRSNSLLTVEFDRFSKFQRVLRTMAYVVRFIQRCRTGHIQPTQYYSLELRSNELKASLIHLIKLVQKECFPNELTLLLEKRQCPKSSCLFKITPFLDDDGIIRVDSRLKAAEALPYRAKHPIVLPRKHRFTLLMLNSFHVMYQHQHYETVVNEVRQRYYISRLRVVLRKIRQSCQVCKNRDARPDPPQMASLPPARVCTYAAPFTHTGVDYVGPLSVMVGRRTEKRWLALFTCLTIRAVHIEVAYKLDAEHCILCFRNFFARRGQPRHIYCDQGRNFIATERILKEELKKMPAEAIARKFVSPDLTFHFNPPASPHMGGAWERLVKSIKIALYNALPERTPTDPNLLSCVIAAESIVNSRPLTYLPLDSEESEAITPNHFLLGSSSGEKPMAPIDDDNTVLKCSYLYRERFANNMWKRFVSEYLPELLLRSKWHNKTEPLKCGDIVLIVDQRFPRCNWPKGRIICTKLAADGQVRSATVQTSTGVFDRPATKMVKLKINDGTAVQLENAVPGGSVKS